MSSDERVRTLCAESKWIGNGFVYKWVDFVFVLVMGISGT